jgi:hypothetical protein
LQEDFKEDDYDEELLDKLFNEDNSGVEESENEVLVKAGYDFSKDLPTAPEMDFCKLVIMGTPKAEAYMQAFNRLPGEISPSGYRVAAKRLLLRPRVALQYKIFQDRLTSLAEEDLSKVVYEFNEAIVLAKNLGQPAAMVSGIKAKAGVLGLEKTVNVTNNVVALLDENSKKLLLERVGSMNIIGMEVNPEK